MKKQSALVIIQDFCKRANLPVPTTVYNSTDPGEMQLVALLIAALEDLREATAWDCQKRKYSFDTTASRASYPLPEDFYAPVLGTHYNQETDQTLIGPSSDEEMGYRLYGSTGADSDYRYRIFGPDVDRTTAGQFEIYPTPTAADTLSFEYYTSNLFLPASWDSTSRTPYETMGADTHVCLFDDDICKLGLRAKWYEEKGGAFADAAREFKARIANAKGRMRGDRVGSFSARAAGPRYSTPYRNWSLT